MSTADARLFFTVNLLSIQSWLDGGYVAVMFDPDDWFAYVRWKAEQTHD